MSSPDPRLRQDALIGRGLTADVFTWGGDTVLKLFFPWRPASSAEREFAVTRAVHAAGLPAPAALDLIEIDGRRGIVFERVRGESLVRQVERKPWTVFAAARQLAELHARLHASPAPDGLRSQREQVQHWVDRATVPEAEKEAARRHLAKLPPGDRVCHGDFHPGNILLTERGPVIIDWSAATRGHAPADVARTCVLFESALPPEGTSLRIRLLAKVARRAIHETYLKRYLDRRPGTVDEVEFWRVPQRMAASAWRAERDAAIKELAGQFK